jgi:hypothetical protein
MANFCRAPKSLLRNPRHFPASIPQAIQADLIRPGTYDIFDEDNYLVKVPYGNNGWKGPQARLVGIWGGDDAGNRLEVVPRDPIVEVTLVSETPIAPHLWVYLLKALPDDPNRPCMDRTVLLARTSADAPGKPKGTLHAQPLKVQLLPELVVNGTLPNFNGGARQITVDAIIAECARQGVTMREQVAYILATAQHESGFTPIRERNFIPDPTGEIQRRGLHYNAADGKDYIYYGRGYVQLTHIGNYRDYGRRLQADLEFDPDLALQPSVALYVLVHGMTNGTFTGQRLSHFIAPGPPRRVDFFHARRVVNGLDRAAEIEAVARTWLTRLQAQAAPQPAAP